MKQLLFALLLSLGISQLQAQEECTSALTIADKMPGFLGCDESMSESERQTCTTEKMQAFFKERYEVPSKARWRNLEGTVVANFLVEKNGRISNIHLEGETGYGIGDAVKEVLNAMPPFTPGQHEGNTECVFMQFDIPLSGKFPEKKPRGIFKVAEQMPSFKHPDCDILESQAELKQCADKKMLEYVYKNLQYPIEARSNGIEGTVVVQFIIDTEGNISDGKIVREIGGGCGEEALRIVETMSGMWNPGYQRGKAVPVQFNLPVRFRL